MMAWGERTGCVGWVRVRPVSTLPIDGATITPDGTHRVMENFSLAKFGRRCGLKAATAIPKEAGIFTSERY